MTTFKPGNIPDELRERDQWLMWDASADTPRRPHWAGDFGISWSDPDDWHTFDEAVEQASRVDSWGIGYVMALDGDYARGLYGCLDLDGCLGDDGRPKDWLPSLEPFIEDGAYIERSPSGDGLHIPLVGQLAPGWWADSHFSPDEHEGVEYLTNKFVTFTGDVLHADELEPDGVAETNPAPFLYDAYKTLNGEGPTLETAGSDDGHDDREWTESDIKELLEHVSSNCPYPRWRNIAFAVHDWDDGATGKSLFESWSRGGGWDADSQRYIDQIWSSSSQGGSGNVTLGTLVYHAKQGGWEPSSSSPSPEEVLNGEAGGSSDDDGREPASGNGSNDGGDSPQQEADDGLPSWDNIYSAYRAAEGTDERLTPRYEATRRLDETGAWRCLIENDSLWRYDHDTGIYRDDGDERIREALVSNLHEEFRAGEAREIREQIRGRNQIREEDMGGPAQHIATENCVLKLDRDGVEVMDHDPEFEFIGRVQTPYDPDAECPRFRSFVQESVKSDQQVKTLQEYAGYALMHWALPYHKALFLVGPTASGKSTFLDTIRAMLGHDATASLTPQQMTSERFGGAELYGSWANIRNDIPASVIEDTGQFKEITAGDPIKAEQKYDDPFFFEPNSKHMFSANQLPEADTDDEAFFRRILLVAFPTTVPRGERDPQLADKLESELSGILNWCLEGLQRLQQHGRFTQDRTPGRTQDTWDKWGNSVKRFAKTCLEEVGSDESMRKAELHQIYLNFCDGEGIPAETQHQLTRKLKMEGFDDGREYEGGERHRVFFGVGLTGRGEGYRETDGSGGDSGASTVSDY
jgi:putative DNA primase/helicase